MSYDVTNVRFLNCDFSLGYYGALLGESMDGSSNGLTKGPRGVQFNSSSWSQIGQQALYVKPAAGADSGTGPRNIISQNNWYAETIANNWEGVESINEVPVIQFDNDECSSILDFFERTDQRNRTFSDSTSPSNAPPEVQGIGISTKQIKQITLTNNTSSATDTGIYIPGLNDKGVKIVYKINRASTYRVGTFTISAAGEFSSYNDDFEESNGTVGVTLTAKGSDGDSTAGADTIRVQYTTTSTGTNATMDYQVTIIS